MPTAPTHALAGLAVGELLAPGPMPAAYHVLTAGLGLLPDIDAVGFALGVPYGSRFGHRGLSHSLLCAAAAGLAAALALAPFLDAPWWLLWPAFAGVIIVEATKQLYQGIPARARSRLRPAFRPALVPPPASARSR